MKHLFLLLFCLTTGVPLFSQTTSNIQQPLSVNGTGNAPDPSAQLDVSSGTKGMLVPRMTTGERTTIASPVNGLLVYDTNTNSFWHFNGMVWANLTTARTLQDADGNTKIQVEESPNEDIIRFDLGGTESMVLRKNAGGWPRLEFLGTNTFVGKDAGSANTTGGFNTASGRDALLSNTTGNANTASGRDALRFNTGGNFNTASGITALYSNSTGNGNTANGADALRFNTTGYSNVAVGRDALFRNTVRSNLVAVGDSALYNNGLGTSNPFFARANTAIGSKALFANTTGSSNTASGHGALYSNVNGDFNTASGASALYENTGGAYNTANGWAALRFNQTGSNNTASGAGALFFSISSCNTANGSQALASNSTGSNNTAIGNHALNNNLVHSHLVAVGDSALFNNGLNITDTDLSIENTALGSKALFANTSGFSNTASGFHALVANATGYLNTASGANALVSNISGVQNTANGASAMYSNTAGSFNTASGSEALSSNLNGTNNIASGNQALNNNTNGNNNTASGSSALFSNTVGSDNTASGILALFNNTEGNGNTGIGYSADVLSNNLTNATAIGYNAKVGASNSLVLGGTGADAVNVGIGKTNPEVRLHAHTTDPSGTNGIVGYFQRAGAGDVGISFSQEGVIAYGIVHPVGGGLEFYRDRWPGGAGTLQMKIADSGKVGIGEAAPSHILTVKSAVDSETLRLIGPGATFGHQARLNFGDADIVYIDEPVDDQMRLQAVRVGIRRTPLTNALEVEGDASKSSAGDWLANSDARLKKNIQPLNSQLMLQSLLALRGVTYEWNDDKTGSKRPEGIQYGFTAQNIQEVFPTQVEEDKLGYLQTAYGTYDAMTVEAIRALNTEIEALKSLCRELGAENERLRTVETQLNKITAALLVLGIEVR